MMNKDEIMILVGNNIRKYRTGQKLTQEQLAEKIGISTSFCSKLERGKKSMSIATLRDIANALEISVNYLLFEKTKEIISKILKCYCKISQMLLSFLLKN